MEKPTEITFEDFWERFLFFCNREIFNDQELMTGRTTKNLLGSANKYKKLAQTAFNELIAEQEEKEGK
jgi:hypothetical protein